MAGATTRHPNEGLDLSGFDYTALKGKSFDKYLELVMGPRIDEDDKTSRREGGLDVNKKYRFEVYKVRPTYKQLFPGSKVDKTEYLNGIELERDKPVKTTLTTLQNALLLNGQVESKQVTGEGGSAPTYLYYLLEKAPVTEASKDEAPKEKAPADDAPKEKAPAAGKDKQAK